MGGISRAGSGVRRRRRRLAVLVLGLGVLTVLFAFGESSTVRRLGGEVRSMNGWALVVGLMCSGAAVLNRALLNRAAHRAVGLDASTWPMAKTSAVAFAAQKVLKVAAPASLLVFVRHGRRRGHAPAAVAVACILTSTAAFGALGILFVAAVALLAVHAPVAGWWLVVGGVFAVYACLVGLCVAGARRGASTGRLQRLWQRLSDRVGLLRRFDSLPEDLAAVRDRLASTQLRSRSMVPVVVHAVLSKALGVSMLVAAAAATGTDLTVSDGVTIYAAALAASFVSVVPGGLGVVEGSVVALLIASGTPAGGAASAVALFRVFDLWLPVAVGAALGWAELGQAVRADTDEEDELVVTSGRGFPVPALATTGA